MGPASGFYQKWLLVKAAYPGSLIGCGIKHLGDAVGYPFSVVQTGLSGSSWLKGSSPFPPSMRRPRPLAYAHACRPPVP